MRRFRLLFACCTALALVSWCCATAAVARSAAHRLTPRVIVHVTPDRPQPYNTRFGIHVKVVGDAAAPRGRIVIDVGDGTACDDILKSDGHAPYCSADDPEAGTHRYAVHYYGDHEYLPATTHYTLSVTKIRPKIELETLGPGTPEGLAAVLTADITPAPNYGTVTFSSDGHVIKGCTRLRANDEPECSPVLPLGRHHLTVRFNGDHDLYPAVARAVFVVAKPLVITTTTLPPGKPGRAYRTQLRTTGGLAPLRWYVAYGGLPSGLRLSKSGVISGTPTRVGTWSFEAEVYSADGDLSQQPLRLSVTTNGVAVLSYYLPRGYVGADYHRALQAGGGTSPYTWKITAGGLPDGLKLSSSGIVSGTPTRPGTWSVTLEAVDAAGRTATRTLRLRIAEPVASTLSMRCPHAVVGKTTTCTLTATNAKGSGSIPAPTGELDYQDGRAFLGRCTLPKAFATYESSTSCHVRITWQGSGTYDVDLSYGGDAAHVAEQGSASWTVAPAKGGLNTTSAMSCPGAQAGENTRCTITVTNSPASKTPAPTGTAQFGYLNQEGEGDGRSCTLVPAKSGHSAHCTFTWDFDNDAGVPSQVGIYYSGDKHHRATSRTVTLKT